MAAPTNSVLPVIAGTVEVGETLTCSQGTWAGATSYVYAWLRSGVVITGATTSTYTLTTADIEATIAGRVTATNVDGSLAADSLPTIAVPSTLVIETGALIAGADSYVTLAEATTYHAKKGNTTWATTTAVNREIALRKATTYIDQKYYNRWKGAQINPLTQSLQWPRAGVKVAQEQVYYDVPPSYYDTQYSGFLTITTIPQRLKDAVCEAALISLSEDLNPSLKRGGKVTSVTVGPISQTFSDSAPSTTTHQIIDRLLVAFLKAGGTTTLERS